MNGALQDRRIGHKSVVRDDAHVAALDGLRGVAVAAVVAYHLRPDWVPGGFLGVDLFFVLSGYLITSLLLEERSRSGSIDLVAFAGRRVRRLLPPALVVVMTVVVHEVWRGDPGRVEEIRRHAIGTLAYVANWVFIADGDSYFADVAGPSMLRHVWSLAIEEQFYVLWPATVLIAARIGGRRAVVVSGLVAGLVSVALMASLFESGDPSRAYFGTDTRIFEPLIGALGALLWPLRHSLPAWVARVGPIAGGAWVVAVFVVDDEWAGFYRGGAAVLGLVALLTVLAAATPGRTSRFLAASPLVALGVISYGVYLWHWPLMLMLRRMGWDGAAVDLGVVVLTLLVSAVSYVVIERPIRRGGRSVVGGARTWRPLVIASLSVVVAVSAVALMTSEDAPADAVTASDVIMGLTEGEGLHAGLPNTATVVLIGDSSAWTLGGGEVTSGKDHGPYVSPFDADQITLVNLARKGYRLVLDPVGETSRNPEDLEHEAWWIETVETLEPDLVVVMFGLNTLGVAVSDGQVDLAATPAGALLATLAGSAPLMVVGAPNLVAADMPNPDTAEIFAAASKSLIQQLNESLRGFADGDERINFVDFGAWLCPGGDDPALRNGCRTTPTGNPIRYDGTHYTAAGAAVASEWLTEPILAAASTPP